MKSNFIWFLDIPPGKYTTRQFLELTNPKQTYAAVYQRLSILGVQKIPMKDKEKIAKNDKYFWHWKGAPYYLKESSNHKK